MLLGVISPKARTSRVMTIVETVGPYTPPTRRVKQHGGKRGRTDVHDIVFNQNGAEQAVIALDQGQCMGGFLVTIIRCFSGESRSANCTLFRPLKNADKPIRTIQCDDHKCTAIVHGGTINSFYSLFMCKKYTF